MFLFSSAELCQILLIIDISDEVGVLYTSRVPYLTLHDESTGPPELRDYFDLCSKTPQWLIDIFEELEEHEAADAMRDMIDALTHVFESEVCAHIFPQIFV